MMYKAEDQETHSIVAVKKVIIQHEGYMLLLAANQFFSVFDMFFFCIN